MGIMGEMMNEAVDAAMDNDDLEEETDEEISKVLNEVLAGNTKNQRRNPLSNSSFPGKVGQLPSVAIGEKVPGAAATADADSEEDDMERRLQALRS